MIPNDPKKNNLLLNGGPGRPTVTFGNTPGQGTVMNPVLSQPPLPVIRGPSLLPPSSKNPTNTFGPPRLRPPIGPPGSVSTNATPRRTPSPSVLGGSNPSDARQSPVPQTQMVSNRPLSAPTSSRPTEQPVTTSTVASPTTAASASVRSYFSAAAVSSTFLGNHSGLPPSSSTPGPEALPSSPAQSTTASTSQASSTPSDRTIGSPSSSSSGLFPTSPPASTTAASTNIGLPMYTSAASRFPSPTPTGFQSSAPTGFQSSASTRVQSSTPTGFQSSAPAGFQSSAPTGFQSSAPTGFQSSASTGFASSAPGSSGFPSYTPTRFPAPVPGGFPSAAPGGYSLAPGLQAPSPGTLMNPKATGTPGYFPSTSTSDKAMNQPPPSVLIRQPPMSTSSYSPGTSSYPSGTTSARPLPTSNSIPPSSLPVQPMTSRDQNPGQAASFQPAPRFGGPSYPPVSTGPALLRGSSFGPPPVTMAPPLPQGGSMVNGQGLAPPSMTSPLVPAPGPVQPPARQPPPPMGSPPGYANGSPSPHVGLPRHPQRPLYPDAQSQQQLNGPSANQLIPGVQNMNVVRGGYDKAWGHQAVDLTAHRNIISIASQFPESPDVTLPNEYWTKMNTSTELFKCTLAKIPDTHALLQRSRLPLGLLIHPFKDLNQLPVIQCSTIVRCRNCRTYINPFVSFVDQRRWKCNVCFRVNDIPEEFLFDPVTNSFGDPGRRPEVKSSTIEFIAPSEYMLRPPQAATYVFLLDVSYNAIQTGYLELLTKILKENLEKLPGDARTQIAFIAFHKSIHFFAISPEFNQPQMLVVSDVDDIFLPTPENLLVNLKDNQEMIQDFLTSLPDLFRPEKTGFESVSSLGAALQAAYKLIAPIGGRITVFQTCLPTHGPGALTARENPNERAGKEVHHLNPSTDFYKKFALDCSGQQIAVDLFLLSSQYSDLATLSGMSKFSAGSIYYYPGFQYPANVLMTTKLEEEFQRYLVRKIGFEAVMRIRCTRGMSMHTFHGNFFVRSTDLLSLPNVNPDAGFGIQVSLDDALTTMQTVCFQAAVLYTSSKGERRIRVHTICLPVTNNISEIMASADQRAIVGLISKMAVDRACASSIVDAREAFVNMMVDIMTSFRTIQGGGPGRLQCPITLAIMPLMILGLMKSMGFRLGLSTRLDDRVFALNQFKTLPLPDLLKLVLPHLYPLHHIMTMTPPPAPPADGSQTPSPVPVALPNLSLSYESIESVGAYLLDQGERMVMFVCRNIHPEFLSKVLGVASFAELQDGFELPELEGENELSERVSNFIESLATSRTVPPTFVILREDSKQRHLFTEALIADRSEAGSSYVEFLQHLASNVK